MSTYLDLRVMSGHLPITEVKLLYQPAVGWIEGNLLYPTIFCRGAGVFPETSKD